MNQLNIRKLSLILLILASCTPKSENNLDFYIRDSKAFLTDLIKNDIPGATEYFYIDNSSTAGRLQEDLALTRERLICFNDSDYVIEYVRFHVQDSEDFDDNRPFYLRFSIACGGRKKFVHTYYHPEHHKIFFVRDYFNEEEIDKE